MKKNSREKANRFEKNLILEATEIVFNNNTFVYNNTHYKQIKGTAMGSKITPT